MLQDDYTHKRKRVKGAQRAECAGTLPNALLALTFAFLDLRDLANARCACKLFSKAQAARARLVFPIDIRNAACNKLLNACSKGHVENLAVASARVGDDVVAWASACKNLKKLTLCEAAVTSLAPLKRCASLTHLTLVSVRSLTNLDTLTEPPEKAHNARIAGCLNLTDLTIESCQSLTEVGNLWTLSGLKRLIIANCEALKVFGYFGSSGLRYLNIQGCVSLQDIDTLQGMQSLETLILDGCQALNDLYAFHRLPLNLRSLSMVDCFNVSEFTWLERCVGLRSLDLENCGVVVLPDLSPELTELDLSQCTSLICIKSLKACTRLKKLSLRNCSVPLDGLSPNLKKLYASNHTSVEDTACFANLHALHTLDLHGCRLLDDLWGLRGCTRLKIVDLSDCPALEILCGLHACAELEMLSLQRCGRLKYISALSTCRALETLDLTGCVQLVPGEVDHVLHVDNILC
jgi:Leucine-rich repeat (LRR) protein